MTEIPLADWWRVARGRGVSMRRWSKENVPSPKPLPAHVGLWLDRMLPEPYSKTVQEWTGRQQLYEAAIRALTLKESPEKDPPAVQSYRPLFAAWREEMESGGPGTVRRCTPFAASSRILLHPASNSSITDGSILLHHTYGVPYLPGSALKGILRARLDRMAAGQSPEAQRLQDLTGEILGRLGNPSGASDVDVPGLASLLDFHDALWIPERPDPDRTSTSDWSPLALDIVNPHHPSYYTGKEGERHAPCDKDEPVPVHRLSYSPQTRFLVVAEAPDLPALTPWLDWLLDDVLPAALAEDGIGAWTTAGYGRLAPVHPRRNTAGTTTSEPEPAVADDPWLPVLNMFYDAGRGELRARLPDQREPRASRLQTQALLAGLPDDLRSALQKNRKRNVEVRIAAEGLQWRLVDLRLAETQQ